MIPNACRVVLLATASVALPAGAPALAQLTWGNFSYEAQVVPSTEVGWRGDEDCCRGTQHETDSRFGW